MFFYVFKNYKGVIMHLLLSGGPPFYSNSINAEEKIVN